MKIVLLSAIFAALLLGASAQTMAGNAWGGYTGVERSKPNYRAAPSRSYDPPRHSYPQRPMPPRPHYPQRPTHWGYPPAQSQSGLNIQYQVPTTIYQNSNSYSWVNGDPNVARIESSRYSVISDWQRLGLPAPPRGSYWIYENGRYVLVPNR
ncbi:RcnB family protein [Acinetobacter sp. YH12151]|uniref:RcnB family protein n=1 Tax=Acinetobacter sp. YH12151 TaxID=2601131 RepID=UPI0015D2821C|nr:RcnB family protein [Acinetobacter sp. YH12151]